jgi:hypothetical protein
MAGKNRLEVIKTFYPHVDRIVDARKDLHIEVTARDNKGATVKSLNQCALARACTRAEKLDGMMISLSTAYAIDGKTAYRYVVPPSIAREIVTFDRFKAFEPGEYKLKAPSKSNRMGARPGRPRGKSTKTRPGAGKLHHHQTVGVRRLQAAP